MGQSPKGNETTDDKSYTGLIGGATDMGEFYPNISRYTMKPTKLSKTDDVIISIRATLGHPIICDGEYCLGRGVAALRSSTISNRLIRFFMINSEEHLHKVATGTTFVQVSKIDIEQMMFPLPPLPEQQRIVDRIESLFEKLDRAKELAQNALDSFETRKAAILHKAFTGELTAKWRGENGVGIESWKKKPLSELCDSFQYGTSKKSNQCGDVAVLRMGNLQNGEIDWNDLAYTSDKEDIKKYYLYKGDVLFNRTNSPELVGKTSIYRGEIPAIFAGYLIRIKYNDCLDGYYLNYVMNSQSARKYCNSIKSDGVNQSNINAKKLASFEIPYCDILEQQEIVRILDHLFKKERHARELYNVIEKIELTKKALLSRAFRGELGTNDPAYESVAVLFRKGLT